jgi:hypothetical protein
VVQPDGMDAKLHLARARRRGMFTPRNGDLALGEKLQGAHGRHGDGLAPLSVLASS